MIIADIYSLTLHSTLSKHLKDSNLFNLKCMRSAIIILIL